MKIENWKLKIEGCRRMVAEGVLSCRSLIALIIWADIVCVVSQIDFSHWILQIDCNCADVLCCLAIIVILFGVVLNTLVSLAFVWSQNICQLVLCDITRMWWWRLCRSQLTIRMTMNIWLSAFPNKKSYFYKLQCNTQPYAVLFIILVFL